MAENPETSPRLSFIVPTAAGVLAVIGLVLYLRSEPEPPAEPIEPAASAPNDSRRADRVQQRLDALRKAHSDSTAKKAGGGNDAAPMAGGAAPVAEQMPGRPSGAAPKPMNPGAVHPAAPPAAEQAPIIDDGDDPDDIPSLRRMAIDDADPERRLAAVTLLGASDDPAAIPIIAQALQDKDEEVRLAAIQSLADVAGEVPIDALGSAAINDPASDNRYEALEALSDVGGPAARAYIEKAANDPDEDVADLAHSLLDSDDSYEEDDGGAPPAGMQR